MLTKPRLGQTGLRAPFLVPMTVIRVGRSLIAQLLLALSLQRSPSSVRTASPAVSLDLIAMLRCLMKRTPTALCAPWTATATPSPRSETTAASAIASCYTMTNSRMPLFRTQVPTVLLLASMHLPKSFGLLAKLYMQRRLKLNARTQHTLTHYLLSSTLQASPYHR